MKRCITGEVRFYICWHLHKWALMGPIRHMLRDLRKVTKPKQLPNTYKQSLGYYTRMQKTKQTAQTTTQQLHASSHNLPHLKETPSNSTRTQKAKSTPGKPPYDTNNVSVLVWYCFGDVLVMFGWCFSDVLLSPPDLPFLKFWKNWKYSKNMFWCSWPF